MNDADKAIDEYMETLTDGERMLIRDLPSYRQGVADISRNCNLPLDRAVWAVAQCLLRSRTEVN